jgi:hypothetical protein
MFNFFREKESSQGKSDSKLRSHHQEFGGSLPERLIAFGLIYIYISSYLSKWFVEVVLGRQLFGLRVGLHHLLLVLHQLLLVVLSILLIVLTALITWWIQTIYIPSIYCPMPPMPSMPSIPYNYWSRYYISRKTSLNIYYTCRRKLMTYLLRLNDIWVEEMLMLLV